MNCGSPSGSRVTNYTQTSLISTYKNHETITEKTFEIDQAINF